MSGHTPGPWRSIKEGPFSHRTIVGPDGWPEIGQILNSTDASLIAAAPDLLEALKAMNQAWMCNVEWHDWEASVKQAEAAIAKAEGRA